MKRSLVSYVWLLILISMAILDLLAEGNQLLLYALPLCGLAVQNGYLGVLIGIVYVLVAWIALLLLHMGQPVVLWQAGVVLVTPFIAAWVAQLRCRGTDLERMQRHLLAGLRDGVILSSPDHVIHLANPAACTYLHLPTSRGNWMSYFEQIGLREQWESCLRDTQHASTHEYTIENYLLQITVTPVIEAGQVCGLVTTIVDFTAERQMITIREDFLALISHELRNPLTSINGFAEVMLSDRMPEPVLRYARVIKRNTDRMLRLIHDLLQLRSFETGGFEIQPQLTDLTEVLRYLADSMQMAVKETGVNLRIDCPDEAVWGMYDQDRITQVFANLLDNAMKYTPRGQAINLVVSLQQQSVLVEVHDCGPGIPAHELDRVFEKYYQTRAGRISGAGTGLGLTISRHLVELHAGRIWATSSKTGTSFWVELPRYREEMYEYPDDGACAMSLRAAESPTSYQSETPGD